MDELMLEQENNNSQLKIDEDTKQGVYVSVREYRPMPEGALKSYIAHIRLTHTQAQDLHAWLDLYLYPDMSNPCPDGLDECK